MDLHGGGLLARQPHIQGNQLRCQVAKASTALTSIAIFAYDLYGFCSCRQDRLLHTNKTPGRDHGRGLPHSKLQNSHHLTSLLPPGRSFGSLGGCLHRFELLDPRLH